MGRPLFSTLIAPAAAAPAPAVRVAEPEEKLPTYERWSYVNAFDPDSEEFFKDDNVVYEAFLTPEEIAERESTVSTTETRVEVSTTTSAVRRRLLSAAQASGVTAIEIVPGEDERPELLSPSVDSGSDTASSGRVSPAETDELLDTSRTRRDELDGEWNSPYRISGLDNIPPSPAPLSEQSLARSLPSTPTRASWLAESPVVFSQGDELPPPPASAPMDIPASPMPHPAQAVMSPMTPPGSVTPRFLTWGGSSRPRAIDMSPSPTPGAPFGSARASRMSVAYISPPTLRVQQ
ncbi:uncharacterized protein FOMMEDRAFT_148353 [Fomitiporia mediterranea MF3/22]|uniref:uncharacterized protein n=1 Tax=Fomitiporia mediterranea (strain MF3/22) TaxID=694068 RepID=UPI0004407633|nr:uncharacterized protein FOMMEDRAFT_148353 [Fomitiporia mediterranea MF3/22]EJC99955.1 hypothetical protein FOMMEDRAFT_148353 [Fomitiporia mediterranea MF3/22]